ncbi:MAG: glycoside hydrolase [Clostridiaceae bacterium]|jgi:alpha-L-fucosidase|nr:glycoside hydrolase [Clostridiaceae bacterium]
MKFNDERDIFFKRRFGMFVHWGIYSIPAWHEQVIWRGKIKRSEYERYAHQFNPAKFDPDEWIDIAKEAGMEYICFTAKHHDGFCMWDTAFTDYNIMNTPYGRDVLGQLAEACQRRNMALSIYYSLPDWHHPNYPNMGRSHEMFGPRKGDSPDAEKYLEFVKNQVRELCTKYGKIYQFFWDLNSANFLDESINDMIRSLQPGILINDRGPGPGDYSTPERHVPEGKVFSRPTEACQALGRESWGYKEDEDYYSCIHIMRSIDKILAMGGNYLLNVGPKADGTIAPENIRMLRKIGKWYKTVFEAFDGTYPASCLTTNDDVLLTKKDNTVYVHLWKEPEVNRVILEPLDILPKKAILLNNGQELECRVDITPWHWREIPYLRIRNIPVDEMTDTVLVVKLEFDESINE